MKKLGLCVRYDCDNFGSMLQIFATQKAIRDMGWNYEHIRYDKKTLMFMVKNLTRIFNPYFMRGKILGFQKKRKLKNYPEIQRGNAERKNMIARFRKKYIGPYSDVYKGYDNLVKNASNYDAVMVGSDQLWTPAGIKSKFYNLLFVPDNIPKIAFATSFGISTVPESQRKATKNYLERIENISVREIQGSKIVKELTGRDVTVALDPTLLYNGDDWRKFFPVKKECDEKYIFAYFLGGNPEHRRAVKELKKKTGLKIITCPFMDEFVPADLKFGDEKRFKAGPEEFLNLIRGAEYICTDSFHGSVFSVLNHKKFMTFNRFSEGEKQSRNSRIDSLFALLGLEKRRYSGINSIFESISKDIDYDSVDRKLNEQRKITYAFLQNALKGVE